MKENLTQARVYVTTEAECSSNRLNGNWLEVIHYKTPDEFDKSCHRLHFDEKEPQFIYFDYENIIPVYISQKWISPGIFPLVRSISELSIQEQTGFTAWLNYYRPDLGSWDCEKLVEKFKSGLVAKCRDMEAFALYHAKEHLNITKESHPMFDLKSYARQLFRYEYLYIDGDIYQKQVFR